jgi:hypothetical protein
VREPRDGLHVFSIALRRHPVRPVGVSRGHCHPRFQQQLHEADAIGEPQVAMGGMQLRVGRAERHPVVVPSIENHDHFRVKRDHVALQLRKTLL